MLIERSFDAARANEMANHPSVRRYVSEAPGLVDISGIIQHPGVVVLVGAFGTLLGVRYEPCGYEAHCWVLPQGSGRWARDFLAAGAKWVFTRTDAFDLTTRIPEGYSAPRALAVRAGTTHEFTTYPGGIWQGRMTPMHTYSLSLNKWAGFAPGFDGVHGRYFEIMLEMARQGQLRKAVAFYNRWALLSRLRTVECVDADPLTLRFDFGTVRVLPEGWEFLP